MIPGTEYLNNLVQANTALERIANDPDTPRHVSVYVKRVVDNLETEIIRHSYSASLAVLNTVTKDWGRSIGDEVFRTHDGECDRVGQPWPTDPQCPDPETETFHMRPDE